MFDQLKVVNNTGVQITPMIVLPDGTVRSLPPVAAAGTPTFALSAYLANAVNALTFQYCRTSLATVLVSSTVKFNYTANANSVVTYTCTTPAPGNITRQPRDVDERKA